MRLVVHAWKYASTTSRVVLMSRAYQIQGSQETCARATPPRGRAARSEDGCQRGVGKGSDAGGTDWYRGRGRGPTTKLAPTAVALPLELYPAAFCLRSY